MAHTVETELPGSRFPSKSSWRGARRSVQAMRWRLCIPTRRRTRIQCTANGAIHATRCRSPFFTISQKEDGSSEAPDPEQARDVIAKLQAFDADDGILVIAAHDATLLDVMEYLPATANEWRASGWKEKARWSFLKDLEEPLRIKQSEKN